MVLSGKGEDCFGVIRVFKDRLELRLWRRAHFCLGEAEFIFGDGEREVCDGAHSLFVTKKSGAILFKTLHLTSDTIHAKVETPEAEGSTLVLVPIMVVWLH